MQKTRDSSANNLGQKSYEISHNTENTSTISMSWEYQGRNLLDISVSRAHAHLRRPDNGSPCRKLKLEHIGGVVHPRVAPESRGLRFGRRAG
jgi:hypothetical protein